MSDLISVIVPVYKVEKYLDKCIQSIVDQTYTNLEIILVDDGSPDNCPQICDKWEKKDSRIKVIHKENGGLSDARNFGLDVAQGEFISFIDSDDYIDCTMLEKLHQRIYKDKSDLAICSLTYIDEKYNKLDIELDVIKDGFCLGNKVWDYCKNNNINNYASVAWNKLYKSKIFKDLRYPKGKIHEDVFIWHEIVERCSKISFLKDKLYFYLQRESSITGKNISFKNLDLVEGFMINSQYFEKKNMNEYAMTTLLTAISVMVKINGQVQLDAEEKEIYIKLKKEIIKTSFYILKGHFNFKLFIRTVFFKVSEKIYSWQTDLVFKQKNFMKKE